MGAIYPGFLLIVVFFLAVGLVGSTDEDQRCDDWQGGCNLFESQLTPQSNGTQVSPPSIKKRIAVIANSIDLELATEFFGFLSNEGMETVHITASDFGQYNEEKFMIILGGPDAPEGIGSIVQEILSEAEQNVIREKGAKKIYVKTHVWAQGQNVIVIAGSNREETKKAHEANLDGILHTISQD
jgi:hypothetical protein